MTTPFLIVAGVVIVAIVALLLDHRLALAALQRAQPPSTPDRDAGFNEGLDRALEIVKGTSLSYNSEKATLHAAIYGARRR